MKFLNYLKPEPTPSQIRPPFRVCAWVLFIASLISLAIGIYFAVFTHDSSAIGISVSCLIGSVMFGRIATFGRYP